MRLFIAFHLNEREAARTAGVTVLNDVDGLDCSVNGKGAAKFILGGAEVHFSNEHVFHFSPVKRAEDSGGYENKLRPRQRRAVAALEEHL